jgi:hypothetical protein
MSSVPCKKTSNRISLTETKVVRSWFGNCHAGYFVSPRLEVAAGKNGKEAMMPVWAWVLIIVLLVLLLTGGIYVRR